MTDEERQKIELTFARCSGFVKMVTGVANNAALAVMRHAYCQIADIRDKDSYMERPRQPHHNYRHKAKMLFGQAMRDVAAYRSRLMHPNRGDVRFFCVSDMTPDTRKKYGDMTDEDYFAFWEGTGSEAYRKTQPLITSLWNKFRKSFDEHGIHSAAQSAWGLTAMTCLQLAVEIWEGAMLSVREAVESRLTDEFIWRVYQPFSLQRVAASWKQALVTLSPESACYRLDGSDERNIELGVQQLRDAWLSPDMPFSATMQAVDDFGDLFRTQGERKKAIREMSEMRQEAIDEYQKVKDSKTRKAV